MAARESRNDQVYEQLKTRLAGSDPTRELLVTSLSQRLQALKIEQNLTRIRNISRTLMEPKIDNYRKIPVQQIKRRQPSAKQQSLAILAARAQRLQSAWTASGLKSSSFEEDFEAAKETFMQRQARKCQLIKTAQERT